MRYDLKEHIWILEESDVLDQLGYSLTEQLGDVNIVDFFLEEVSHDIYEYVFSNSIELNHETIQYLFSTDEYKHFIEKALYAQIRYALRSRGGHLIKDTTGVDMDSMILFEDGLYDRTIAPQAKQILRRSQLLKEVYLGGVPSDKVKGVDY